MKKTLAIVSYSIESVNSYYAQIKSLFRDKIEVGKISIDDSEIENGIYADVILMPSYHMFGKIKKYIKSKCDLVFASRTISKLGLEKILNIENGEEVILIDESPEMTEQMISVIYQLGVSHINLKSYWSMEEKDIQDEIVIIIGQSDYLPDTSKEVINIGNSLLDFNTIIDIGMKFNLMPMLNRQDIARSYREVATVNFGLAEILKVTNSRESQLDILLQVTDAGIIGIKPEGNIFLYNDIAEDVIGIREDKIINRNGIELFPQIPFEYALKNLKPVEEKLVKLNGYDVVASVNPLIHSKNLYGAISIIRKYSDTEKKQHILRKQLIGKGHKAKYNFDDIIGESAALTKCKKIAKRMAKSNSSILITGETGTGKELFAQAIHNNSPRKNYQFVAVNCGAIPENLLESELFGYEEGAFTGAKKGGKSGLFELAHNGTLFLDEITEMSMDLQVKLLRVLEEREIIRIGGNRMIDVDVRIIAATNNDIKNMVRTGEFREDLYYRLNVLPLRIPPLRARKEDILFLIEEFKKEFKSDFILTENAKKSLLNHSWNGNVRELRNYVEYFVNLDLKEIDTKNFPFDHEESIDNGFEDKYEKELMVNFLEMAGTNIRKYIFLLEELEKGYIDNRRLGRRSLHQIAKKKNIFISEQEIRSMLVNLEKFSMVEIFKGRSGTVITEYGIRALRYLQMG
ncbi:sigma-54 interaction domain-containing protein [Anaerosalibacter bizertensis]|uniref:Sigma 54-interacting transcriptional regulator n=1 Tax=Anaerosalibacter bizertensis TaxID=932217 RepID=A0A9Q4ACU3_9FIRM|nr:sigma 54-interacting transcriptional regulator [Anaerosalibacter bizertensis]MCG4565271.1 sigma 54-interacting transcriptional regulator [Anaerosalibacter bizertensis]